MSYCSLSGRALIGFRISPQVPPKALSLDVLMMLHLLKYFLPAVSRAVVGKMRRSNLLNPSVLNWSKVVILPSSLIKNEPGKRVITIHSQHRCTYCVVVKVRQTN